MRRRRISALALVLVSCAQGAASPSPTSVSSAAPASPSASAIPYPVTVTDDQGHALTLTAAPERIISLERSPEEMVRRDPEVIVLADARFWRRRTSSRRVPAGRSSVRSKRTRCTRSTTTS